MILKRGFSDGEVLQGDAALAAILGASSPGTVKPENVDASGLPVGTASAAVTVIEVATVAAVMVALVLAVRLFE